MPGLPGGPVERVGVEVVAQTGKFFRQLDSAVDKGQGKMARFGKALGKAAVAGAAVGGVALAGLGAAAVKMGIDFEQSIAEVKTLLPGLSEEGFKSLQNDVLDLSKEMGIATSELVPALYSAISAGIPPENVIDFLREGGKAAIGGVTDLETAVDGLSTVVNAFGLDASETGKVADVMFTGVKLGKTTMEELSRSMFQAAPLAASLGLKIEDVVGATATLTKSGTPTSVAMAQMRAAMTALAKPTTDMNKLLEKTGFESGEALLQAKGFAGALDVLNDAADGNKETLGKAFGSVEALQAVLGLTGDNAATAAADLDAMNNATGAANEAFETMDATTSRKLAKAMNLIKVEMTKIGLKVLPLLASGITFAVKAVGSLVDIIKALVGLFKGTLTRDTQEMHASFVALPSALIPVAKILMELARVIRDDIGPAIKEWVEDNGPKIIQHLQEFGKVILDIGKAVLPIILDALEQVIDLFQFLAKNVLEPVVLPVLKAVGGFLLDHKPLLIALAAAILLLTNPWLAVIAVIVLVLAKWDDITEFLTKTLPGAFATAWAAIDSWISGIPVIGEVWDVAKEVVADKVQAIIGIVKGLIDFGTELVSFFKNLFSGEWGAAWADLKDLAMIGIQLLLDFLQLGFLGTLKSIFGAIVPWEWVEDKIGDFVEMVSKAFEEVVDFAEEVGEAIFEGIADGAKAAWLPVKRFFGGVGKRIAGAVARPAMILFDVGAKVIGGLVDGAKMVFNRNVAFWQTGIGSRILAAIGDAASWLFDVGGVVIQGLLDGVNAVWESDVVQWWLDIDELIIDAIGDAARFLVDIGEDILEGLLDGLKAAWRSDVVQWWLDIDQLILNAIGDAARFLVNTGDKILRGLFDGVRQGWNNNVAFWTGLGTAVVNAIGRVLGPPVSFLLSVGRDIIQGVFDGAREVWDNNVTFWGDMAGEVISAFAEIPALLGGFAFSFWLAARRLGLEIKGGLIAAFGAFGDIGRGIANMVIDALNWAFDKVNKAIPNSISLGPFGSINLPDDPLKPIRHVQHGGPVAAGELVRVNELGTEFFRPFSAGTVLPVAPAGGGAGGGNRLTNYGRIVNFFGQPRRSTADTLRDIDRMVR